MINNLYVKLNVYFTLITIIHSVWQLHGSSQGDTESQGAARRVFCNNNLLISGLLTVNTQELELTARGSTVCGNTSSPLLAEGGCVRNADAARSQCSVFSVPVQLQPWPSVPPSHHTSRAKTSRQLPNIPDCYDSSVLPCPHMQALRI